MSCLVDIGKNASRGAKCCIENRSNQIGFSGSCRDHVWPVVFLCRRRLSDRGLTLLELVVVLLILAALGTVMITQTTGLTGETRYQQTVRTLAQLENAVLGDPDLRGPDGQRLVTGFVADVGRLPESLDELWLSDSPSVAGALALFAIDKTPAGDSSITLAGGWRGPYLRLPIGADELTDGWGRPFVILDEDGKAIGSGPIQMVGSLGQDAVVGGNGLDRDLPIVFEASATALESAGTADIHAIKTPVPARYEADVSVRVTRADGLALTVGEFVVIRVYGPDPVTGLVHTIDQQVHKVGNISSGADGLSVEDKVLRLSIGPRVIRAYQVATAPLTAEDDLSGAPLLNDPVSFVMSGGVTLGFDLKLEGP